MIAFTDPAVHPASPDFYRQFPWEPVVGTREIRIERVVEVRQMTLESLLLSIGREVAVGGDVMIIHHGTARGLSLPITNGQRRVHADDRVLQFMMDERLSDGDLASRLMVNEATALQLRRLSANVRALSLRCVLLRACNVGQNRPALQNGKRFFGSQQFGAPDLRDAYARLNPDRPSSDPAYRNRWLARHAQTRVYELPQHGWLALATSGIAPGRIGFQLHALTDSHHSIGYFMDVWLTRLHRAHTYRGGALPVHAVIDPTAGFPLWFPGEDEYTEHMIIV